jgi:hypothetical protein
MKRLITLLAVLLVFTIFMMPTYAKPPEHAAKPIPVRFQKFFSIDTGGNSGGVTIYPVADLGVAEGQLLVVEYASLQLCVQGTTQAIDTSIGIVVPNEPGPEDDEIDAFFFSPGNPVIGQLATYYSTGQNLRLYVDSTEEILFFITLTGNADFNGYGSISGYIIDSDSYSLSP